MIRPKAISPHINVGRNREQGTWHVLHGARVIATFYDPVRPWIYARSIPVAKPSESPVAFDFNNMRLDQVQAEPVIDSINHVMGFGKYQGCSLEDVIMWDPGYVLWLHNAPYIDTQLPQSVISLAQARQKRLLGNPAAPTAEEGLAAITALAENQMENQTKRSTFKPVQKQILESV